MKSILKFSLVAVLPAMLFAGCEEVDEVTPVPNTNSSNLAAFIHFVNAAPGLPSADLLVNNEKVGESAALGATSRVKYFRVPLSSNAVGNNTNVRARATTNTIGGVLGSSDAIFRGGNNNTNNLSLANGTSYTFILLDSVNRPRPLRLLNAGNFGDTTFYNRANGQQISTVQRAALNSADKQQLVPLGIVPLGSTDPGGPRFVMLTDALTLTPSTTNSFIRFVNAVPNAVNPIARGMSINGNTVTGLTARLVGPANIDVGANANFIMGFSAGFSPSVGSRLTTAAFTARATTAAGVPNTYTLQIIRHLGGATAADGTPQGVLLSIPGLQFEANRYYTIVASGIIGKTGDAGLKVSIIRHDNSDN